VGRRWAILWAAGLAACQTDLSAPTSATLAPSADGEHEFLPLPARVEGLNPAHVELGRRLFDDPVLSANGRLKCSTCHPLAEAGMDGKRHSLGVSKQLFWNTPSIFNLAFSHRFNWKGRFETLEDELSAPALSPAMGNASWDDVVARLKESHWDESFRRAGFDGVSVPAIQTAIADFERSLVTPDSRFDQYLKGKTDALSAEELEGLRLFKAFGCVSCHQGRNVGGNMLQRIGVVLDYLNLPGREGNPQEKDERDPGHLLLRVPSLRNVACTAPYLHDGTRQTLEEAIQIMGRHQIGRRLDNADVRRIKAFLITLTGQYPAGHWVCEDH